MAGSSYSWLMTNKHPKTNVYTKLQTDIMRCLYWVIIVNSETIIADTEVVVSEYMQSPMLMCLGSCLIRLPHSILTSVFLSHLHQCLTQWYFLIANIGHTKILNPQHVIGKGQLVYHSTHDVVWGWFVARYFNQKDSKYRMRWWFISHSSSLYFCFIIGTLSIDYNYLKFECNSGSS